MSEPAAAPAATVAPPGPITEFWSYFRENKGAVAGLVTFVVICLLAIFADFVAPHEPTRQYRDAFLVPPFWQDGGSLVHLLGTDAVGRDILSRLIYGARYSLIIGVIVVILSLTLGIALGLVAAAFRGVVEISIMRLMDIMLALPSLLLAVAIVAILGPGLINTVIAIAVVKHRSEKGAGYPWVRSSL